MKIILPLLLLISSANSFSLVPKFRDYGFLRPPDELLPLLELEDLELPELYDREGEELL